MADNFKPHEVWLSGDELRDAPYSIRMHVEEGGSLYMVEEPKQKGVVFISTDIDKTKGVQTYVDMEGVYQKAELNEARHPGLIEDDIVRHVEEGGDLYIKGNPKGNGVVFIYTSPDEAADHVRRSTTSMYALKGDFTFSPRNRSLTEEEREMLESANEEPKEWWNDEDAARERAADFGMTPEEMTEMGLYPDGTPYDSGPGALDPREDDDDFAAKLSELGDGGPQQGK